MENDKKEVLATEEVVQTEKDVLLTEEQVFEVVEALKKAVDLHYDITGKPFDVQEFANGIKAGGAFTPMAQNELMKRINIDVLPSDKNAIDEALKNPASNENKLVSFGQSYYFSSLMYKRNIEYIANLPAFDLELTCINAESDDYKSSKYKADYKIVKDFFDKFNYREQFTDITWNLLMEETYYGMFRELGTKHVFQNWPWKYAKISGKFEYGLLYDVDMTWFSQPQVDIKCYPEWCIKKYKEMFQDGKQKAYVPSNKTNDRTGHFGVWAQTDPADGFWCFKFNPKHNLQVPFFSAMLPEMAIVPLMRNLQVNQSMAAARKLLVSSIPYLNDKKSSTVANALAIDADVLGKFIGMASQGLEKAIKLISLPTEDIRGVEFENTDKDTYKNFMSITSALLSGGKVIFSVGERLNVLETQLSLNIDELLIESIYPQFENFLEYVINQKTKKFKWKFHFVGSKDAESIKRRQDEAFVYADKGIVLPNKIASALGMNKIELERELEEAKATGFTDKLMLLLNINTAQTDAGGRPQKPNSELTDSGAETRTKGSNIAKGGKV